MHENHQLHCSWFTATIKEVQFWENYTQNVALFLI